MKHLFFPGILVFILIFPVCQTYAKTQTGKSQVNKTQANEVTAGEYETDTGWGTLKISNAKNQTLNFSIVAIGGNASTCTLNGEIQNNLAVLHNDTPDQPCIIKFQPKDTGIDVSSSKPDNCRYFCGARANFIGLYLKPVPGCSDKEQQQTRQLFKQLYDKKAYKKAYTTLEPLLRLCIKTLDWLDFASISNDLAVTQYHLGLFADCQNTLAAVTASVGQTGQPFPKTEKGLKAMLPPADFDNYLPIAKTTWTNTRLCSQTNAGKPAKKK
jgi:hypothetical protein